MSNKTEILAKHLAAFKQETLLLLRSQVAYDRLFEFNDIQNISRSEFIDKVIALKAIENDMLMRICKFDDKRKDVHSFHNVLKELSKGHQRNHITKIVKAFCDCIKHVKQERRHDRLAHLAFGKSDDEYSPTWNLKPAIKYVLQIIDLFNGSECNYKWQDGSMEKYDLKEVFFKNYNS